MQMIGKFFGKTKMLIRFSVKAQGISHIEKGIPCQDACNAQLGQNKQVGIACVADGHGSGKHFRSDKGSVLAIQVAERALFDFCGTIAREKSAFFNHKAINIVKKDNIRSKLKELEGNIIYSWREAVNNDLIQNPLNETEIEICKNNNILFDNSDTGNLIIIYGSTLLTGLVSDNFWFVLKIGDGNCVIINETGEALALPELEDDRLAFGRTSSLCDNEAINNFREAYGFSCIEGLTVATDGVTDSFESEKYLQFNKELYEKFTNLSVEFAQKELEKFLPELSERGSRDDVSIAGIFRKHIGKESL